MVTNPRQIAMINHHPASDASSLRRGYIRTSRACLPVAVTAPSNASTQTSCLYSIYAENVKAIHSLQR